MYDEAPTEYSSAWRYCRRGVSIDKAPEVAAVDTLDADTERLTAAPTT